MTRQFHQFLGRDLHNPVSPLVLVLAWVLLMSIIGVLVPLLPRTLIAALHFLSLGAIGFFAWSQANSKVSIREQWLGNEGFLSVLGIGVAIGILAWAGLNFVIQPGLIWFFTQVGIPIPPVQTDIRAALTQGGGVAMLNMAITAFLAPTAEELFYRGAFFSSATAHYGIRVALCAQAVFFGFVHFNLLVAIVTATLGLINGLILVRRVALAIPVVIHIVFNLLSVIVVLLQRG